MFRSVTKIGHDTFSGCTSLTTIFIKDVLTDDVNGLNSIGANAMENCINLTTITLPNSLTAIEQ